MIKINNKIIKDYKIDICRILLYILYIYFLLYFILIYFSFYFKLYNLYVFRSYMFLEVLYFYIMNVSKKMYKALSQKKKNIQFYSIYENTGLKEKHLLHY